MDWINLLDVSDEAKRLIKKWIWLDRVGVAAMTVATVCMLLAIVAAWFK